MRSLPPETDDPEVPEQAVQGLIDLIWVRYGYDFRGYTRPSLRRRIRRVLLRFNLSLAALTQWVSSDAGFFYRLLDDLTVSVTEMFRDAGFYLAFRSAVLPFLQTYPHLKLWVAGCATGEEAYSLAILLDEARLYERSLIYATDLNPVAVARARDGIYPVDLMRGYAESHRRAGGTTPLGHHFTVRHGHAAIDPRLKRNIHFAEHNLTSDQVFGEMNVVLCRNVLIYFDQKLQEECLRLFDASLTAGGFLGLGSKETLAITRYADAFSEVVPGSRIYRRKLPLGNAADGR